MKKKNKKSRNKKLLEATSRIFFPGFSELQYIVIFFALVFLLFSVGFEFILFALLLYPLFILALGIFTKAKLASKYKVWICVIYYVFFALLAIYVLDQQNQATGMTNSSLENISLFVTKVMSIIFVIRGFIAFILVRGFGTEDKDLNEYITQNFKDHQYTYEAFIAAFVITLTFMYILSIFYDDIATLLFLTVIYSLWALKAIEYLLPNIKHGENTWFKL